MQKDPDILKCDYLVVGGGIAGVSCISQLYSMGGIEENDEKVILLSPCDYIKMAKIDCKITQTLNEITPVVKSCDGVFGDYKNFKFVSGFLEEISPKKHTVSIKTAINGKVVSDIKSMIHYKKLILCTGARPKTLPFLIEGAIFLRDRDSADKFVKALENSNNVCIVGNGGIALELIYTLEHCSITWIARSKNIGHAFYDEATSLFLQDYVKCKEEKDIEKPDIEAPPTKGEIIKIDHFDAYLKEKFGYSLGPNWHKHIDFKRIMKQKSDKTVDIKLKTEITKVTVNNTDQTHKNKYTVSLSTGEEISTDVIIIAIGVVPNTDYVVAEGQTLEKDSIGAIKVNHLMKSSIEDIYAAGDCCCVDLGPITSADNDRVNCWFQKRLWCQARYMGLRVAEIVSQPQLSALTSMVPIQFEIFSHFTRIFGLTAIMLGRYNIDKNASDDTEILLRVNKQNCEYIRCVVVRDRMVGALFIGKCDQTFELAETFENLILNQTNLHSLKEHLLDPNIDIADYFD